MLAGQAVLDGLLRVRVAEDAGLDVGAKVALQIELGRLLEANDAGVEEGDVGGAPAGEVQPLLDVAAGRGVQLGEVGLVDVVDGEVEPE